jgi:hypothetical protein
VNRRWTLILALGVFLASVSMTRTAVVFGDNGSSVITNPVAPPPTPGMGDPDVPTGPGKSLRPGAVSGGTPYVSTRVVGDNPVGTSSMMLRLRAVLQAIRGFWFRF